MFFQNLAMAVRSGEKHQRQARQRTPGTAVFSSEQVLTALIDISRVEREAVVNDATPKATSVVSVAKECLAGGCAPPAHR
jgi:hypothetical protein